MIKKRIKKEEIIIESDSEENVSESLFAIYRKTYEEQAIEVLNILESKGINIYDSSRFGGMYLKKSKNSNKLNEFFQQNKQSINNNNDDNPKDLKNLFEFFNKKKNNG